jgi:hypothetical protein
MILFRLCAVIAATVWAVPVAPPAAHAAVAQTLITQRILAQQGLSIGLATITLRSQFVAFGGLFFTPGECTSIGGGGSFKTISQTVVPPATYSGRVKIYFDAACTKLYIDENLSMRTISASPPTYLLSATAKVYSKLGAMVGTLRLTNNRLSGPTSTTLKLIGIQTFDPVATNAPELDMGISCEMPRNSTILKPAALQLPGDIVCTAGVAQDFALIGMAAASLSKVTLRVATDGKVTFLQTTPAQLKTGALGTLSVAVTTAGVVSITGTSTPYSTTTMSGQASQLTLFPPKPVTWSVVDQGHATKFTIQLLDNTTRNLSGTIRSTTNLLISPFTLDQSGTGRITYSNGVIAPISSWVLAK